MRPKDASTIPDNRGFVTCAKHDTRRKVAYCTIRPVYDADLEVVSYQYECKEGQTCTSRRVAYQQFSLNTTKESGVSDRSPEGQNISSPTIKIIDCSSSRMLGSDIRNWDQSKSDRGTGTLSTDTRAEAGTFSVLFTKKAEDKSTSDFEDHNYIKGMKNSSNEAVDGKDNKKDDSDEALSRNLKNPQDLGIATSTLPESASQAQLSTNGGLLQNQEVTGGTGIVTPALVASRVATSSRYFELRLTSGGGGSTFPTKVCWNCGLLDHEKPDCPNLLCRNCHGKRGPMTQKHLCGEIHAASPFVVLPRSSGALPQCINGMPEVQCVYCHRLGHFDCSNGRATIRDTVSVNPIMSTHPEDAALSCCYCGGRGHTGYECHKRQRVHPDRWVQRNLMVATHREAEENRRGEGTVAFHQHQFNQDSVPASRDQQFFRDSYQRKSSNGEHRYNTDAGSSDAYRSSYRRWSSKEHTAKDHQTRYENHDLEDNGLQRTWKVENSSHHNIGYDNRYDRHSRRHCSEKDRWGDGNGRSTHRNRDYPDSKTTSSYYNRQAHHLDQYKGENTDHMITKREQRGGRRGYSGFSSDEDLF